jgi:hypothetical protein
MGESRVFAKGRDCGRGESRDRPLCPRGTECGVLSRELVAPWDRVVSPGFRDVELGGEGI